MTLPAAIAYLRTLRSHKTRGLSQADVADRIGVTTQQVYRWERRGEEPRAEHIARYIEAVRGSAEQVHYLIITPGMTAQDGERLADLWASGVIQQIVPDMMRDPDILAEILKRLRRLSPEWRSAIVEQLSRDADLPPHE